MSERVEQYAAWLESLITATYGFRERSQQQRLKEAAELLRELDRDYRGLKRVLATLVQKEGGTVVVTAAEIVRAGELEHLCEQVSGTWLLRLKGPAR